MPTRKFKLDGAVGAMAIMNYGTNDAAMADPSPYISDLYFHSNLAYTAITAKASSTSLAFSKLTRNYVTWDDGDKCGCFITTAVVKYNKHADDCDVLNTLRKFRDTYMIGDREQYVKEYYKLAPRIVQEIELLDNAEYIFNRLYNKYIISAVNAIESNKNELAFKIYRDMFEEARLYARS